MRGFDLYADRATYQTSGAKIYRILSKESRSSGRHFKKHVLNVELSKLS